MASTIKVFVAYDQSDEKYVKGRHCLFSYLRPLEHRGLEFWWEEQIAAGDVWNETIELQIRESHIILVLVSHLFLGSAYCISQQVREFLDSFDEKDKVVLPVILSRCDWRDYRWLRQHKFLPTEGTLEEHYTEPGKQKALFKDIYDHILRQAIRIRAGREKAALDNTTAKEVRLAELARDLNKPLRRILSDAKCKKLLTRRNVKSVSQNTAVKIRRMYEGTRTDFLDLPDLIRDCAPARCIASSADGRLLATLHDDATIHLWQIGDFSVHKFYRLQRDFGAPHSLAVRTMTDGWEVAAGMKHGLQIWRIARDGTTQRQAKRAHESLAALQYTQQGSQLLLINKSEHIQIVSSDDINHTLQSFRAVGQNLTSGAFCSNDRYVLAGSERGEVLVWDRQSGEGLPGIREHDKAAISALIGFNNNGVYLSTTQSDQAYVLRTCVGEGIRKRIELPVLPSCMARHPAGLLFVGLKDRSLQARELMKGSVRWSARFAGAPVATAALGRRGVGIVKSDGSIEIRQAATGHVLGTILALEGGKWFALNAAHQVVGEGYERYLGFCGKIEIKRTHKRSNFTIV